MKRKAPSLKEPQFHFDDSCSASFASAQWCLKSLKYRTSDPNVRGEDRFCHWHQFHQIMSLANSNPYFSFLSDVCFKKSNQLHTNLLHVKILVTTDECFLFQIFGCTLQKQFWWICEVRIVYCVVEIAEGFSWSLLLPLLKRYCQLKNTQLKN